MGRLVTGNLFICFPWLYFSIDVATQTCRFHSELEDSRMRRDGCSSIFQMFVVLRDLLSTSCRNVTGLALRLTREYYTNSRLTKCIMAASNKPHLLSDRSSVSNRVIISLSFTFPYQATVSGVILTGRYLQQNVAAILVMCRKYAITYSAPRTYLRFVLQPNSLTYTFRMETEYYQNLWGLWEIP